MLTITYSDETGVIDTCQLQELQNYIDYYFSQAFHNNLTIKSILWEEQLI